MVHSYDLITETATLSTISSPLLYNGQSGFSVITPNDYVQKIYKLMITNTGTSTATVTLTANPNVSGLPSYTVATISIPAGDTVVFSEHDFDIILTTGYNLTASISAETGTIQALAYFEKGAPAIQAQAQALPKV